MIFGGCAWWGACLLGLAACGRTELTPLPDFDTHATDGTVDSVAVDGPEIVATAPLPNASAWRVSVTLRDITSTM
jgi:hypothetical protein